MRKILLLFILTFSVLEVFSQEKQISFADDSLMTVNNSVLSGKKTQMPAKYSTVSFVSREFIADLTGIGKAIPPFDNVNLKIIQRRNKTLAGQIRKIDSAYALAQNQTKYYFAGLNSINYDKFNNCSPEKPCKVKCQAMIIQLSNKSTKENILILKSFDFEP